MFPTTHPGAGHPKGSLMPHLPPLYAAVYAAMLAVVVSRARDQHGTRRLELTVTDLAVWLAVYHFRNRSTGLCFPSLRTIAKQAGCSVEGARLSVERLRLGHWLDWTERPRLVGRSRRITRFYSLALQPPKSRPNFPPQQVSKKKEGLRAGELVGNLRRLEPSVAEMDRAARLVAAQHIALVGVGGYQPRVSPTKRAWGLGR